MMKTINGIAKRHKPRFQRQCIQRIKSVSNRDRWRHPTGRHSKMRRHHRGHSMPIATGFGSDKRIRGLTLTGVKPIRIHTLEELQKIDKKTEGAIISKNVGQKNKLELVKKAKELGIRVLNVASIDDYIKNTEERFNKKKEEKLMTEKQKEEKKKELDQKAKEAELKKEEKTEEDKKKEEKELKEKILTKG